MEKVFLARAVERSETDWDVLKKSPRKRGEPLRSRVREVYFKIDGLTIFVGVVLLLFGRYLGEKI